MKSFAELCFVRTFRAMAHGKPQRRQQLNDLLLAMREHRWVDFDSWSPGSLGIAVLVTYPKSAIRRLAWEALSQHAESSRVDVELASLLHVDDSTVGRFAFFDDVDHQRADLLMEALRYRARPLKRFLYAWLNVDWDTPLQEFLNAGGQTAVDETGRDVGPTAEGLFHSAILEVLNGLHFPEHASSLSALLVRAAISRVMVMPPRGHEPKWLGKASTHEKQVIERSRTLDDRERLILMAAIYGELSTEIVAEAMMDKVHPDFQSGRTSVAVLRGLELEYAEKLWNAWRHVLPAGRDAEAR